MTHITVRWHDKTKGIQLLYFQGDWTWEEYFAVIEESNEMMREADPQRIDIIAYMKESGRLPLNAITHVRSAGTNRPENWGITVIVGGGTFVNMMLEIGRRVTPHLAHRYHAADTFEDALKLIETNRTQAEQV